MIKGIKEQEEEEELKVNDEFTEIRTDTTRRHKVYTLYEHLKLKTMDRRGYKIEEEWQQLL